MLSLSVSFFADLSLFGGNDFLEGWSAPQHYPLFLVEPPMLTYEFREVYSDNKVIADVRDGN